LLAALAVVAAVLVYGHVRLDAEPTVRDESEVVRIALIQGSIDTEFNNETRDQLMQRLRRIFREYHDLTVRATSENSDLDLIVWPESMFSSLGNIVSYDEDYRPDPARYESVDEFRQDADYSRLVFERDAQGMAARAGAPLLVGTDAWHHGVDSTGHFNSALLIGRDGKLIERYDKMHPVMFGEYVPLGNWLPWLYHLTPMSGGLTPGRTPVAMEVGGLILSPNICFENMVPHLIRRQVAQLKAAGQPPDILVTLTNDGWFWGSSLLDLHLTCGRFRAVEMRLPTLIAANTGFSAWIDGSGRVRAVGPRRSQGIVMARVGRDGRESLYLRWGDAFAGVCLLVCMASALWGVWSNWRGPRVSSPELAAG
jgi:apolipoprotein N-acyltransferase